MKALSIKPEYVKQILRGEKTIELRSWRTKHRGDLLICASRPDGMARCIVELVDVRPFVRADAAAACSNYRPGLFAWVFTRVRPIESFHVRGNLRTFNVRVPADKLQTREGEVAAPPGPVGGMPVS